MIDSAKVQQQTKKAPAVVKDTEVPIVPKAQASTIIKDTLIEKEAFIPATPSADSLLAEQSNSVILIDSLQKDSANLVALVAPKIPLKWLQDTTFMKLLTIFSSKTNAPSLYKDGSMRIPPSREALFYLMLCILLFLAIIKQLFPKYFKQLFSIMFQASYRQKQTREQLMQEKIPSLLMNILFVIVGGLFIALISGINKWVNTSFWWLTLYSITFLALVYMLKYLVIQFMGWAFQVKEPASTYRFIVFLINKIIGLALLPILFLLAFSGGYIQEVAVTVAFCVVIFLLVFRYILSLTIIRGALSIHPIHFFIYLCTVELLPMLIIYKVLFNFTGKSN